jgi:hypothetical protein
MLLKISQAWDTSEFCYIRKWMHSTLRWILNPITASALCKQLASVILQYSNKETKLRLTNYFTSHLQEFFKSPQGWWHHCLMQRIFVWMCRIHLNCKKSSECQCFSLSSHFLIPCTFFLRSGLHIWQLTLRHSNTNPHNQNSTRSHKNQKPGIPDNGNQDGQSGWVSLGHLLTWNKHNLRWLSSVVLV